MYTEGEHTMQIVRVLQTEFIAVSEWCEHAE